MQIYNGKSVFGGIAIGKISVYQKKEQQVKRVKIDDPEQEMARYEKAKAEGIKQLQGLYDKALREVGEANAAIFEVHQMMMERTGKHVEVMIYGDGAFKDPVGKIWELADPVVSPAYTEGLEGQPNELKLKYLADNDFADLSGEELKKAISERIRTKDDNLVGDMASQGTTPRRLTDLIGSLCDLTSGSGDKGTPIIFIQGYFDNYTK